MKKLLSTVLIVLLCASLTSCVGNNSEIVGTWRTYDLGVSIDSPELPPYFTFTFAPDGTGSGPVSTLDRLDTPTFTYSVEDNVINVLTDENKEILMTYTLEEDTMTIEFGGYTRVLEKVSDDILFEFY